jgi:anti-anti-sigma factor
MAFTSSVAIAGDTVRMTLSGELDAASAPAFRAQIEQASSDSVRRLVLLLQALSYMASAGLRALAFARQKMGPEVTIYIIGADETIKETLTMTGFQHSVILLDSLDEALR